MATTPEAKVAGSDGGKKQKPPNLDLVDKGGKEEESVGLSGDGGCRRGSGNKEQRSQQPSESNTKSPRLDSRPKSQLSDPSPKSPRPDATPSPEPTVKSVDTPPKSPRPPHCLTDSPKRMPDSPLRSDSSKQAQLHERHMERRGHQHHDSHRGSSEHHRHVSKSDSVASHRKHSATDSDDEQPPHHHHHHHRSPKRTMSERRRSQRSPSTGNSTEHRRTSSVGGPGSRRSSMRTSERRKSSVHDHTGLPGHRRLSHDRASITDGTKSNGSPVHIEYYKKPSHPTGPYMSPGLSSAYKTPAAEVLIASLIIIVGLVALITSWATGTKVWMVVGGVCVGLGGMFMLLGLCWYCALARKKQENEDLEMKILNSKQLLKLARTPSNASQSIPQMV